MVFIFNPIHAQPNSIPQMRFRNNSIDLGILLLRQASIFFLIGCFFDGAVASGNSKYQVCRQAPHCGNVSVQYPFWTDHDFCGQRGFGIDCSSGQPFFNLIFGRFLIQRIEFPSDPWIGSLELQAGDDFNATCLPDFHYSLPPNTASSPTIDVPPNQSDINIKLYFFYNCNSLLSSNRTLQLTCASNGTHHSYVALKSEDQNWASWPEEKACESHFSTYIQLEGGDSTRERNTINYTRYLKDNFTLRWAITTLCKECRSSGGACGRSEKDQFQCFCTDQRESLTCIKGNNDRRLKIGLGAGIGTLGVIIIILFIFMFRYRRAHASSKVLSKNSSAENSLMSELTGSHVFFEVPIFQNKELEEATNNFDSSQELGDGGFGTVYYGKLRDGREVAVKRLYEHNYRRVKQFMTEVQILTRLHHKNLVSLYGCTSRHSRELLLVYEYVPNGTVADHLHGDRAKQGPLSWHVRMNIAIETATALAYLHASDIIHRDVKTNNILLDNNFCVKVGDFGLSRLYPTDVTHISTAPQGTPGYVDPEYHQCYQLTVKSDVYSFGVVLMELVSSMPAVDISRDRYEINLANLAINRIQNKAIDELIDPSLGSGSDIGVREMITGVAELAFTCLQQEKDMRPSMAAVLEELKALASGAKVATKSTSFSPSPETDEARLLKKTIPTSPISVTQKWVSSSSSFTPTTSSYNERPPPI